MVRGINADNLNFPMISINDIDQLNHLIIGKIQKNQLIKYSYYELLLNIWYIDQVSNFFYPKDPDPSKLVILRTLSLLYRFVHPSIGGSNDP